MKIKLTALIIIVLIMISGCSSSKVDENVSIQESILLENEEVNDEIRSEIVYGEYTFDNPYLIIDPYESSPLTALVGFKTEEDMEVKVIVPGDVEEDTIEYTTEASKEHYVPIVGLYADRENKVKLQLLKNNNLIEENEISIETEALPEELINAIEVEGSDEEILKGMTFIAGGNFKKPFAFDSSGNIRWFVDVLTDGHGMFFMENGRYMVMAGYNMVETEFRDYATGIFDMDLMGRLHKIYDIPEGVHHEIIEKTPDGNLLILANSLRNHVEDTVVEVDRDTGEILREIDFNDIIIHEEYNDDYDWAHMNSMDYNYGENTAIFSIRDISSVVKLDMDTEEIIWMISDPEIWEGTDYEKYLLNSLNNDNKWFYEQHSAFEVEDLDNNPDTLDLMIFDNRIIRSKTMTVEIKEDLEISSVVYYAIDEENKTIEEKRRISNSHAFITSNYDVFMEEDRLFANHGSLRPSSDAGIPDMWGEIYEYEYSIGELIRTYKVEHGFYRAYRLEINDIVEKWKLE
ncbi:MAG: aryl-sulfate sulfotransferase [Bacillota bacterium]|nr:aryl-sulfate sulfotransferase [Bacillota bacterium]